MVQLQNYLLVLCIFPPFLYIVPGAGRKGGTGQVQGGAAGQAGAIGMSSSVYFNKGGSSNELLVLASTICRKANRRKWR